MENQHHLFCFIFLHKMAHCSFQQKLLIWNSGIGSFTAFEMKDLCEQDCGCLALSSISLHLWKTADVEEKNKKNRCTQKLSM